MLPSRALLLLLPALALVACGSGATNDSSSEAGTDAGAGTTEPLRDGGGPETACTSCGTSDGGGTDAATSEPARVLLFGGFLSDGSQTGYFDDTWEWSGASWSPRASSGPSGRMQGALASLNGKVVLFGGYGGTTLGDTWVWDGSTWTDKKVAGPPARFGAAITRLGTKLVLFGGQNASYEALGDTWEWDGSTWAERTGTGPSPRTGATLATIGNKAMLFGGMSEEVWSWDGAAWSRIVEDGDFGRSDLSSATINGAVYGFGGTFQGGCYADAWRWSGTTFASVASLPKSLCGATVTGFGAQAILFGGSGYPDGLSAGHQYLANTWTFDGTAFTKQSASGPPGRDRTMMTAY